MKTINRCEHNMKKPMKLKGQGFMVYIRSNRDCGCKASIFELDRWWCKRHAPKKIN